jgi:serine phosphatase RsbU (regulator of sigma subunit)/pSer/pThr/pTyr-binding forkhead associated (FHA) protein
MRDTRKGVKGVVDERPLRLTTVTGPTLGVFEVARGARAAIGRLPTGEIVLPDERVSRRHASIVARGEGWTLADEGSSAGTYLNGVRLAKGDALPLIHSDLVRIGPWTFRVAIGQEVSSTLTGTLDDVSSAMQRLVRVGGPLASTAGRRLRLLTQCIGRLSAARDEGAMAALTLEAAMNGTGFARAALVTPGRAGGEAIDVVASRRKDASDASPLTFSRALIVAASGMGGDAGPAPGTFVLSDSSRPVTSHSIMELEIHSAVCTPVMLGDLLWGLLYLDARGGEAKAARDEAEYCEAVATALGLSLSNLRRDELEHRQRELMSELQAAREVQEAIVPRGRGVSPGLEYSVRMVPGQFVAGDLFDVMDLPGGATGFLIGDVTGHGAGSGMMMAMTQSHLAALLRHTGDLVASVRGANEYLAARAQGGKFATLWLGLLEPGGLLRYVDAGHGLWMVRRADGRVEQPRSRGSVPLGIDADSPFEEERLELGAGDRVVLFSDGVTEQRDGTGDQFGVERLAAAIREGADPEADVATTFERLLAFAAGTMLDDDATVASCLVRSR